ncbi:MAG TPA: serine/threonine protein kinase, partial [Planctomycetaceae bacterium]|nr:serine/threonine protein kinase [Planctomycetaceae bacterium]
MIPYTLEELTQRALTVGVLTQAQIQQIRAHFGAAHVEPEGFLQAAVRLGLLTGYQVERLSSEDSFGFLYGPYKALYIVGAGTFARVFRAVHRDTGEIVAVKVLRARFSDNKAFIEHFLHEAKLGTQLKHPNIVPIYSASSEGYLHFMTMEFVEGQTLREFLKIRKKVDARTATVVVRDIAAGLEYALRRGLQHRDLKLSNVMLAASRQAKLVDFGLASIAEKADVNVPFLKNQQSVDYVALERCRGAKRDDPRSDLYFLGCMYYHMLSGESPFLETKDRTKRLDRNRFFNVKPLRQVESDIPQVVAQIVAKAMQPEADARYQSPTMMLFDLNKALERLETEDGRPTEPAAGDAAAT